MVPVLIVAGSAEGLASTSQVVRLGDRLDLGRRPRPDGPCLRLDGPLVSRDHARVVRKEGRFCVQDLGSRNGTAVDGRIVSAGELDLRDGAVIFVGQYALVFRLVTDEQCSALEREKQDPLLAFSTRSGLMAQLSQRMRALASASEVLLVGETGVGKEVYARAMYAASKRPGPFLAVNCAALPRDLVESELFGYVKGAHSQAVASKRGLVQEADRGTLFLDELGEAPPEVQAKLLRFLQTREYLPLGGTKIQLSEVSVIAATNRDPDHRSIRADLRHRFGDPLSIPPLRWRKEDIPSLVGLFLETRQPKITLSALQALMQYCWPGNVRELENAVRRALLLTGEMAPVDVEHFPAPVTGYLAYALPLRGQGAADGPAGSCASPPAVARKPVRKARSRVSREELVQLLDEHQGRIADVARVLDRRWQVVWKWLKSDGIDPNRFRGRTP
jgi:transcriptional regulator with GAF, ATPase, and Fis domain